ncbi:MAG TPA: aminotransferase class V-fold PLP-dependent enzyme, partial [Anaerolineae bacterium]|nr:aminotransferase class V-fold PLP-dependent enzyme [Anaerolineae bacterium]
MSQHLFTSLAQTAVHYRETLPHLPVGVSASRDELLSLVDTTLPDEGEAPETAIQTLIAGVEKGLIQSGSPRYFGFVVGGATPVSVAADWLTSVWNQNAQVYATSPAASIVEDVVAQWLLELLGLPQAASVGFVTGTQMAHFTALTIARNVMLQRAGWDIDAAGLPGSPPLNVICGECCHATIHSAIRLMGLGTRSIRSVSADEEGRMNLATFRETIESCTGPTIVCVQAGNVNTGAFDPMADIIAVAKKHDAWVHVDGAFGLWAGASPRFKHLVAGVEEADSWATDAHKWLNVPYDSGMVIVRSPEAHRNLKTARCAYAGPEDAARRDGSQWAPENSRRARGFVLYAALRHLGKQGVQRLVENCCDLAQAFATELADLPHVHVLNQVVLNQVLCRVEPPDS